MTLTHGGLFEGYGGTTHAARLALGGLRTRWVSDIKPAACTLLAHHHPAVPNFGDLTRAFPAVGPITREAAALRPVDVITASWPCQPHSSAGKRLGEADPRALWPNVVRVLAEQRPAIFLGENVARIATNGELRRVVRSLTALGYVGAWRVLNASDVGAPHKRARCFVAAVDPAAYALGELVRDEPGRGSRPDGEGSGVARHDGAERPARLTLLPMPRAGDGVRGGGDATAVERAMRGDAGRTSATGLSLNGAVTLLPTPKASDGPKGRPNMRGSSGDLAMPSVAVQIEKAGTWGVYADAVARWETVLDRAAPAPTQPAARAPHGPQLAPAFVEWMMGVEPGHVTAVPKLSRAQQLSLLGDGVVPQQGAAAFRFLLGHLAERLAVERAA